MSSQPDHPPSQSAAPRRPLLPNSSVLLTTVAVLLSGFAFTVGCAAWSLDRAAGRAEREVMTALLYIGIPLLVAALCLLGAAARYRAANRGR